MADGLETAEVPARRDWHAAEFLALYVAVPIAIAVLLPPRMMFLALFAFTLLGLILLARTPGFIWRQLGAGRIAWGAVALFGLAVLAVSWAVVDWRFPQAGFGLVRGHPGLWLAIMLLYPLLSALPQELIFRVLYFRRYEAILPGGRTGLALNAALFSLAHLMYWHWIVSAMTFAGGLVFAQAWRRHGLPMAWALHAAAGCALFTAGLGVLFYSGNVVRPF